MKNTTLSIAIFGIALIASPVASACGSGGCGAGADKQATVKDTKNVKTWTCSMHPEIKSPKPGKCPKCNMKLIPAKK